MKQNTYKRPEAPKPGYTINMSPYGRCRVLRVYDLGTMDIENIETGRCYRVSGCGWLKATD